MTSRSAPALAAYVANLALLSTHQADAAYQREWDVFGVPGGIEFFLAFNLVAVAGLTTGLVLLATGHRFGKHAVFACAGIGLITCILHAFFLGVAPQAFSSAPSLLLLGAILVTSVAQLATRPKRSG